ncbi:hypothetical protein QUA70_20555 [Microcoleus sp. LAD1_D5]
MAIYNMHGVQFLTDKLGKKLLQLLTSKNTEIFGRTCWLNAANRQTFSF